MKRISTFILGLALASGIAYADVPGTLASERGEPALVDSDMPSATSGGAKASTPDASPVKSFDYAQITPAQKQLIDKWVTPEHAPKEVAEILSEAASEVKALIAFASCRANYKSNFLNRPAAYRTPYNDGGPMTELPSHKRGGNACLSVNKVDDWQRLSADGFTFQVIYRSDENDETVAKRYIATRINSVDWKFRYWNQPAQNRAAK